MATTTDATRTGRRRGAPGIDGARGASPPASWVSAIDLTAQAGRQRHAAVARR